MRRILFGAGLAVFSLMGVLGLLHPRTPVRGEDTGRSGHLTAAQITYPVDYPALTKSDKAALEDAQSHGDVPSLRYHGWSILSGLTTGEDIKNPNNVGDYQPLWAGDQWYNKCDLGLLGKGQARMPGCQTVDPCPVTQVAHVKSSVFQVPIQLPIKGPSKGLESSIKYNKFLRDGAVVAKST